MHSTSFVYDAHTHTHSQQKRFLLIVSLVNDFCGIIGNENIVLVVVGYVPFCMHVNYIFERQMQKPDKNAKESTRPHSFYTDKSRWHSRTFCRNLCAFSLSFEYVCV